MSTHKHFDKICVAVVLFALLLTVLFMNGESLGIEKLVDADGEETEDNALFTANDLNGDWDASSAAVIVLTGDGARISGSGAYAYNGGVVIARSGKYRISGTLTDGSITVDAEDNSKVWILLEGVDITCSDDACIRVDQADKVFLTLAEGSANTLQSGESYSAEALSDKTGGVIFAHDDLTINAAGDGSGSLQITAGYKHGIDANDDLKITGGTISIACPQDGMHVNDSLRITGASIEVAASDDGLHCDTEVYIAGGTVLISECYEGIEAHLIDISGGEITIYPEDDGLNANGGAGGFGFFGGFGEPGGSADASEETDADYTPTVNISGGKLTIINETGRDADGLDSNADICITGGDIFVSLTGSGSNSAIDYGSENGGTCLISGGRILACGGSSMAESFDEASEQCSIFYNLSETAEAGTTVALLDASGNTLYEAEVPCSFSSLNLSCGEMKLGETYYLVIGDSYDEVTLTSSVTSIGNSTSFGFGNMSGFGMFGGGGGHGGHGGPGQKEGGGERPEKPEMPDLSEMPEMPEDFEPGEMPQMPEGFEPGEMPNPPDWNSGEGEDRPQMPDQQSGVQETADEASNGISLSELGSDAKLQLAASAAVLILGLIAAAAFKRK